MAQRRASTNFVNDMTVIEEHYLDLAEATLADTGVYICRVSHAFLVAQCAPKKSPNLLQTPNEYTQFFL